MKKLMRLDEAIEKRIVRNLDEVDPNALFPKTLKKVILEPRLTGMDEPQEVLRQDFEWVFFKTRVKRDVNLSILAIRKKENRNASIALRGRVGYFYNFYCWQDLNKMYSNRNHGITAYSISEEDLKLLFERNKKFQGFKFATWIDYCFKEIVPGNDFKAITKNGVKYVIERTIFKQALWYSTNHILTGKFDYCPNIHIWGPKDIMVVLNSKRKNGKWKLIPRKGLLKWWYRLF